MRRALIVGLGVGVAALAGLALASRRAPSPGEVVLEVVPPARPLGDVVLSLQWARPGARLVARGRAIAGVPAPSMVLRIEKRIDRMWGIVVHRRWPSVRLGRWYTVSYTLRPGERGTFRATLILTNPLGRWVGHSRERTIYVGVPPRGEVQLV